MLYEFEKANGKVEFMHFDFDIEAQTQAEKYNKLPMGEWRVVRVGIVIDEDNIKDIWKEKENV